jgi:hypothetical protein
MAGSLSDGGAVVLREIAKRLGLEQMGREAFAFDCRSGASPEISNQ